jgi:branched-chain amino acid transport system permease protein
MRPLHNLIVSVIVVSVVFAISPLFYALSLSYDFMIYALVALCFAQMFKIGYLAFGQGAFFALGAYFTGLSLKYMNFHGDSAWICLLIGVLLALICNAMFGLAAVKRGGVYYPLVTLALGETLFYLILQFKEVTGGDDGLMGIPRPTIGGRPPSSLELYYVTLIIVVICIAILRLIELSHMGRIAVAIKDNEERLAFLGYNVYHVKYMLFLISSLFTSLAGGLYIIYTRYVSIMFTSWLFSGLIVFMSILGGTNSFLGPLMGAGLYLALRSIIGAYTPNWPLIIGIVFICLMYLRKGFIDYILEFIGRKWGVKFEL